ncbi:MAG TPA: hypothetical protein VM848_06955, partial [Acidimicrobiia bacterium]|nr:hypothetical protein [Acidimicrobiia bacterium]
NFVARPEPTARAIAAVLPNIDSNTTNACTILPFDWVQSSSARPRPLGALDPLPQKWSRRDRAG